MLDEYDIDPEEPDGMNEEELLKARCTMCRQITDEFSPGWPEDEYGHDSGLTDHTDNDESRHDDQ
jgi:hypothetical protein